MKMKIAFAGFRHDHIFSLFGHVKDFPALELTAACEEDSATREKLAANQKVQITHDNFDRMLAEVPCDIIAIGDYYAKRGSLALKALKAGKHVITDKPLCTTLDELAQIERAVKESGLKIGCMFDLRTSPNFACAHDLIQNGTLGRILQIQFGGQHKLNREVRPSWYFEPGKHGGTINDIASHAIDLIPWLTGSDFKTIHAARTWQAQDCRCACFNDAAQFMLELENGCGVLGDVSYSSPDSIASLLPSYWRFTIWGTKGMIEFNYADNGVRAWLNGEKEVRVIQPSAGQMPPDYLESFLLDISGVQADLNTEIVLRGCRQTLLIQQKADRA